MNELESEKKKLVIGLYGEMQLAMKLHALGYQVHRGYIDEGIDFVISRYCCKSCKKFSSQFIRQSKFEGKNAKCVTKLRIDINGKVLNKGKKYRYECFKDFHNDFKIFEQIRD